MKEYENPIEPTSEEMERLYADEYGYEENKRMCPTRPRMTED